MVARSLMLAFGLVFVSTHGWAQCPPEESGSEAEDASEEDCDPAPCDEGELEGGAGCAGGASAAFALLWFGSLARRRVR
jgi:hypothetical protein